MGYSKSVYKNAREVMRQRREKSIAQQNMREREIFSKIPRVQEINRELSSLGISAARAVVSGKDAKSELKNLRENSLRLQRELDLLLTDAGYPADYLEPVYECPKCCDKGMYECEEKGITVTCECFKTLLTKLACEELNKTSPLTLSTFESFNTEYYSKESVNGLPAAYPRMKKIFEFCKKYAEEFQNDSQGLFLTGATGLGKTHLSLAIANEVIKKGFGVIYVSAPSLLAKLEKAHFSYSYEAEEETIQALAECDLLIIDDIGTEFISSYSKTALYNIFNNRLLRNRPTIINTNLSFKELEQIYSQRFVSRLYGEFVKLDFIGRDIRVALKQGRAGN